jgi:hypothetical protein
MGVDCMQGNSVLLLRLYEKTSAKGNTYFAGRMGQASVVMMRDLHAEGDDPVWQVFVSEPRQAATDGAGAQRVPMAAQPPAKPLQARKSPPRAKSAAPAGMLDDDISDLGR